MKKIIAIVTILASISAFAGFTKSYKGQLSGDRRFSCTFTNNSGSDLEIIRVRFNAIRYGGQNDHSVSFNQSVGRVLYSGETTTVTLQGTNARVLSGESCFFVAAR
jgi:hypothetical protein